MKTKSIKQITDQLERIRSHYPEYMSNEEYYKSHLPKAYRTWNRFFDNMAWFQWERDQYAQSWEELENEQIPRCVYDKPAKFELRK